MRMAFYPRLSFTGEYIQQVITDKMLSTGYSMEELSDMFRLKSEKVSKVLLLLLIPLTALTLKVIFFKSKRRLYDHFILATEINNFIILILFLLTPLLIGILIWIAGNIPIHDEAMAPYYFIFLVAYFAILLKRFYGQKWWITILKSILFLGLYHVIFNIIYKTILFVIIINLI